MSHKPRGRFFTTAVVCMVVCIVIIPVICAAGLWIVVGQMGSRMDASIKTVFEYGIERHMGMRPQSEGIGHLADAVASDETIRHLLSGTPSDVASDAVDDALDGIARDFGLAVDQKTGEGLSLYLVEQGVFLGPLAKVGLNTTDSLAAALSSCNYATGESARFLFDDGSSTTALIYALSPDVFLIHAIARANELDELVDDLTAVDESFEVAFYDSFGNAHFLTIPREASSGLSYGDFPQTGTVSSFSLESNGRPYTCYCIAYPDSQTVMALFALDSAKLTRDTAATVALITLCAAVVIGTVFLTRFIRGVYRPVQRIASHIDPAQDTGGYDEISVIEQGLSRLEQRDRSQRTMLHKARLLYALQGRNDVLPDETDDGFAFADDGSLMAVALLVDDDPEVCGEISHSTPARERLVEELLRDLAAEGLHDVETADDGILTLLVIGMTGIIGTGEADAQSKYVEQACAALMARAASDQLGGALSIYLSSQVAQPGALPQIYAQIRFLADDCLASERYGTLLRFDDARQDTEGTTTGLDTLQVGAFLTSLRRRSTADVLRAFDTLSSSLLGDAITGAISKESSAVMLIQSLIRLGLASSCANEAEHAIIEAHLDQAFADARSVRDYRASLEESLGLMERLADRSPAEVQRFEQIESYVQEHLLDQNLSSKSLSERFDMSMSNITRLFNKYHGRGFLDHIQLLRIEEAKRLLETSSLPMEEVATSSGFGNALTMTRAFKKHLGTTPGAYRARAKGNDC